MTNLLHNDTNLLLKQHECLLVKERVQCRLFLRCSFLSSNILVIFSTTSISSSVAPLYASIVRSASSASRPCAHDHEAPSGGRSARAVALGMQRNGRIQLTIIDVILLYLKRGRCGGLVGGRRDVHDVVRRLQRVVDRERLLGVDAVLVEIGVDKTLPLLQVHKCSMIGVVCAHECALLASASMCGSSGARVGPIVFFLVFLRQLRLCCEALAVPILDTFVLVLSVPVIAMNECAFTRRRCHYVRACSTSRFQE